jgi:hypothetical protein
MATPFGTLGTIDTLKVGERVFASLSTLISLISYSDGGNRSSMRKHNATAGYAPSGVAYRILAARIVGQNTAAQPGTGLISYGNTDLGINTASAIDTPIYVGGSSSIFLGPAGAGIDHGVALNFLVPAGKFINCASQASTNTVGHVYGYEE